MGSGLDCRNIICFIGLKIILESKYTVLITRAKGLTGPYVTKGLGKRGCWVKSLASNVIDKDAVEQRFPLCIACISPEFPSSKILLSINWVMLTELM